MNTLEYSNVGTQTPFWGKDFVKDLNFHFLCPCWQSGFYEKSESMSQFGFWSQFWLFVISLYKSTFLFLNEKKKNLSNCPFRNTDRWAVERRQTTLWHEKHPVCFQSIHACVCVHVCSHTQFTTTCARTHSHTRRKLNLKLKHTQSWTDVCVFHVLCPGLSLFCGSVGCCCAQSGDWGGAGGGGGGAG